MKNLGIKLKKEEHSSSKHSYIFQVFFHLNSPLTVFEAVGLFQTKWRLGILEVLNSDKICENP